MTLSETLVELNGTTDHAFDVAWGILTKATIHSTPEEKAIYDASQKLMDATVELAALIEGAGFQFKSEHDDT